MTQCPHCDNPAPHTHRDWKAFLRALPTSDREALARELTTTKSAPSGRLADVHTTEDGRTVLVRRRE